MLSKGFLLLAAMVTFLHLSWAAGKYKTPTELATKLQGAKGDARKVKGFTTVVAQGESYNMVLGQEKLESKERLEIPFSIEGTEVTGLIILKIVNGESGPSMKNLAGLPAFLTKNAGIDPQDSMFKTFQANLSANIGDFIVSKVATGNF